MSFNYVTAQMLTTRIKNEFNGRVTKAQLSKLLRETSGTMDARWIRQYAMSMETAGLIKEVELGVFGTVE